MISMAPRIRHFPKHFKLWIRLTRFCYLRLLSLNLFTRPRQLNSKCNCFGGKASLRYQHPQWTCRIDLSDVGSLLLRQYTRIETTPTHVSHRIATTVCQPIT